MAVQPTRGTYTNKKVKLTNCSYYSVKNLSADFRLYIKNSTSATAAQSTTIPPGGSDSSLWQNSNLTIYDDVFLDGQLAGACEFTIECSPGTIATEV